MICLDVEALTESLLDILPKSQHKKIKSQHKKIKSQHKKIPDIIAAINDQSERVTSVVANPAHIEYSDVQYGRGSVGLDASGNLVRASLGDVGEEWDVDFD
jgi:hypothetical protein